MEVPRQLPAMQLGLPQVATAGSYQPRLTWNAGPRLTFSFGFTDPGAGRYLEAWIPANLVFDQFQLTLEVRVTNTAILHSPITNGLVTGLADNETQIGRYIHGNRFWLFSLPGVWNMKGPRSAMRIAYP